MSIKSVLRIDNLRHLASSLDKRPEYFGLGFIQLKLTEKERLHFYSTQLSPILSDEEIHDHRYDFTSLVMKGSLTNELWFYDKADEETDFDLTEVSCSPNDSRDPKVVLNNVRIFQLGSFKINAGEKYSLTSRAFHKVRWTDSTVTQLVRNPVVQEFAHVVRNKKDPYVCPFSAPVGESRCWEIIESIVDVDDEIW